MTFKHFYPHKHVKFHEHGQGCNKKLLMVSFISTQWHLLIRRLTTKSLRTEIVIYNFYRSAMRLSKSFEKKQKNYFSWIWLSDRTRNVD